jgi:hypothetical protein
LIIVGAVSQAAGFIIALLELRSTRSRTDKYETRPQVIEGVTLKAGVVFPPGVVSGSEPPLEERVNRLEKALSVESQERAVADRELGASMEQRISERAASLQRLVRREIDAVAVAAVARPRVQQWVAIGLFLTGLLMVIIGSLI